MQFLRFPVLPGSAETQVISNISAKKKYQNPFTCVKVIASQRRDVFFETRCIHLTIYNETRHKRLTSDERLSLAQHAQTRMWANAQRDGRPAEYRWRPLFNAAKFG